MNTSCTALILATLAATALAGCAASTDSPDEERVASGEAAAERTTSSASALTALGLPADPNWANGFSADAIRLGTDSDGSPLYSCRAAVGSTIQTGKTRASWNSCDVGYGGQELWLGTFQTLVSTWTPASHGAVPPNAVSFGYDSNGAPLYVCRGVYQGAIQTGKVGNNIVGCDIPWGGAEITLAAYEVLNNAYDFPIASETIAEGSPPPPYAITGGTDSDGTVVYPCLASYAGGFHPGKTIPSWGTCDISYGGGEHWVASGYQVLVPGLNPFPLAQATTPYIGGYDTKNGTRFGICSAAYGGATQVGEYMPTGVCSFGYGGREVELTSGFDIFSKFQFTIH